MQRTGLVVILALATAARLWFLNAGIPHAVGSDEPEVIGRAVAILRTGDWNPHAFGYPTLVIYLHAGVAIVRFLLGAVNGEWNSLDAFSVDAIYVAGRLAAALIGALTVYLVYRLARELTGRPAALLAAALLAVHPAHVRESHFILTDIPMTALTTLAVWLSARAVRLHDVRAYAWAAAVAGLAAAAQYNGGIVLAAPLAAWAFAERRHPQRGWMLAAIVLAAAGAFVAGVPFAVLDTPTFLDGFAAYFARFAGAPGTATPPWLLYVLDLSPVFSPATVPLAIAGIVLLLRDARRARAIPLIAFALVYFYVITTHTHVFARDTLPLLPVVAVLTAVSVMTVMGYAQALTGLRRAALLVSVLALLLWPPAAESVRWLEQFKRADTRAIAANWLKANAGKNARVAVENGGPTHLDAAGFRLVTTEQLVDRPVDWYRGRADYLVISAADVSRYGGYLGAAPTVFQIVPTAQRGGPTVVIVKLGDAATR